MNIDPAEIRAIVERLKAKGQLTVQEEKHPRPTFLVGQGLLSCRQCSRMFARRHNAVKYCSEECTEAASTQREQTRPPRSRKGPVHASCQCCNVVYAKKTANQRYCSAVCSGVAARERRGE